MIHLNQVQATLISDKICTSQRNIDVIKLAEEVTTKKPKYSYWFLSDDVRLVGAESLTVLNLPFDQLQVKLLYLFAIAQALRENVMV